MCHFSTIRYVLRGRMTCQYSISLLVSMHSYLHIIPCSKVNGLCICFRQIDLGGRNTPSPKPTRRATTTSSPSSSSSPPSSSRRGGSVKISELSQHMAGVSLSGGTSYRRASGSATTHRAVSPLAQHTRLSSSPSPPPTQAPSSPPPIVGEMASVKQTSILETVPPFTSTAPLESTDSMSSSCPHSNRESFYCCKCVFLCIHVPLSL